MTISMYATSIPVFKRMLRNLDAMLDKAVVYADAKKIEHNTLLTARLAPDMFHLIKQVQIATDQAKGCAARLAGVEPPSYEDNEATFADLKARLAKTISYLETFKPEQIDGSEERKIVLTMGGQEFPFTGIDYLLGFVTPNVYFHVSAAYLILRHNGLDLGKRDFIVGKR